MHRKGNGQHGSEREWSGRPIASAARPVRCQRADREKTGDIGETAARTFSQTGGNRQSRAGPRRPFALSLCDRSGENSDSRTPLKTALIAPAATVRFPTNKGCRRAADPDPPCTGNRGRQAKAGGTKAAQGALFPHIAGSITRNSEDPRRTRHTRTSSRRAECGVASGFRPLPVSLPLSGAGRPAFQSTAWQTALPKTQGGR
jgi:hypothetical protein